METPPSRLVFRLRPLTLALGAVLIGLIALAGWNWSRRPPAPPAEPAQARTARQVREQAGPAAELRQAEAGQRRAVCGYIGRTRGGPAVGFVSTPNRILFSDDPLPKEFAEMRARYCPGFMQGPPQPPPMR
ncbi:MAG: hypothetical protein K5831_09930 [Brevundimonas sp.]|jgi:hypothetical protein|uniref:Uncharacterized protein n=1 Tax=Brevundimonas albigilva TaxID=1312364 RepID=A0ABY4SQI3_9CAUL|nr:MULTISPECIES: hypothetical protein [Brevundimonas]MCV0415186.1 hypothetical protein [Brevundimonas sp.]UQV17230.1 hypothetical protein MU852_09690 [Brevundimonas albigilva]URI14950.1 hypothetical protein M8231_14255 [Brevundimonas albigilva]